MKAVLEKNDNKLKLRGEETTLRVIEGTLHKLFGYYRVFYVMFNKRVGVFYHNIKHDA